MKCPFCYKQTSNEARLCVHCGRNVQNIIKDRVRKITCPTCHIPASIMVLAGLELDVCHECSGIWFDRREMKQFQEYLVERYHYEEVRSIFKTIVSSKEAPTRRVYIDCPVCSEPMIHRNYVKFSGIILDRCPSHGTWAERKDIVKIIDLAASGNLESLLERASQMKLDDLEKKINTLKNEQKINAIRVEQNIATNNEKFIILRFLFEMLRFF